MSVAPVTSSPSFIAGVFSRPFTIRNSGTNPVYLGQDSSLSPFSRAMTLPRGATMQWAGTSELWACTDTGLTSELEWLYNSSSSITDGATVIDGPVTIAGAVEVMGTVALSGGSVALSGPVSIAGGVKVDGSTINVANAVRLANLPVLLSSTPFFIDGTNKATQINIPKVDVSAYASVIVAWVFTPATPGTLALDVLNYVDLNVQTTGAADSYGQAWNAQWLADQCDGIAQATLQVPVRNTTFGGTLTWHKVNQAWGGNGKLLVWGSNETIAAPRYVNATTQMQGALFRGGTFAQGFSDTITNLTTYLGNFNGPASVSIQNGGTSTINAVAKVFSCEDGVATQLVTGFIPSGFGDSVQRNLFMPMRPLRLDTTVGTGSAMRVSVTA